MNERAYTILNCIVAGLRELIQNADEDLVVRLALGLQGLGVFNLDRATGNCAVRLTSDLPAAEDAFDDYLPGPLLPDLGQPVRRVMQAIASDPGPALEAIAELEALKEAVRGNLETVRGRLLAELERGEWRFDLTCAAGVLDNEL